MGWGVRRRRLGLALAAALAVVHAWAADSGPVRHALVSVRLRNTGSSAVRPAVLRLGVPVTNQYQQVMEVRFAPAPRRSDKAPNGCRVAYFRFDRLKPGRTAWVLMLVRCRLRAPHVRKARHVRGPRGEERRRCLGNSHKVDVSSPGVVALAERLGQGAQDRLEVVRRINRHVATEFSYELDDQQLDAATVVSARRGSCSELSRVFVAVARACGVPARYAAGSRMRTSFPGYVDTVHHRWVEVFLEGRGWFPIDVSRNVGENDVERRFGSLPAQYLVLTRNAGLKNTALFSSGLTLVNAADVLERSVRTYWLREIPRDVSSVFGQLGSSGTRPTRRRLRKAVLRLDGVAGVAFLAMALYEPLARRSPRTVVRRLEATGLRAAVVPLVDYLPLARGDDGAAVTAAFPALSGASFQSPSAPS